ncbi:MAG: Obg family GTPase CgtA, partial [Candidatus Pacebacteria bacterium]|nr:Obg family GTPase CgtA [Candidatus Paceibacterota bacterium]
DFFVEAVRDLNILSSYLNEKKFEAGNGEPGGSRSKEGKNGEDFILKVPIGSIVTNKKDGKVFNLLKEGQRELVLHGGSGGYGNEHFKSSRNTTPKETTPGKAGEEADFYIEVELIADIGLVGFPNAGKSSLLNTITNSNSKIGDYPFTTLDPHLGALYGLVLADIPGIIKGASLGKGLGHKFLRHIRRTKKILHVISVENEDVISAYNEIRGELSEYDYELSKKEEVIILSKIDLDDKWEMKKAKLESLGRKVIPFSIIDDEKIKNLSDYLVS